MADLNILQSRTEPYFKTLKEISFDTENNIYMCHDDQNHYCSFDDLIKNEHPQKQPASPDVLMYKNDTIFMVEFKNQKISDISNENIHNKLQKGKEVLLSLLHECNIQRKEYKFVFCVIYKNNSRRWQQGIAKNTIKFGLEKYKDNLFDEIFTNDIDWFKKQYNNIFGIAC